MDALFRRYLIAELFSPGEGMDPVFVLSPVKADERGERIPTFFADGDYHRLRHLHCIFWNSDQSSCKIYEKKPFGCTVLICDKMTQSEPILLQKKYYYRKWLESQQILYRIFPDLEGYSGHLLEIASSGKRGVAEVTKSLNQISSLRH